MTEPTNTTAQPALPIPADDPRHGLALARPDEDSGLRHVGVVSLGTALERGGTMTNASGRCDTTSP